MYCTFDVLVAIVCWDIVDFSKFFFSSPTHTLTHSLDFICKRGLPIMECYTLLQYIGCVQQTYAYIEYRLRIVEYTDSDRSEKQKTNCVNRIRLCQSNVKLISKSLFKSHLSVSFSFHSNCCWCKNGHEQINCNSKRQTRIISFNFGVFDVAATQIEFVQKTCFDIFQPYTDWYSFDDESS